ncbi:hypothetical protein Tco_1222396, partial [Tanacetum coccineum]
YRQAALSKEVDAESGEVRWWKRIRERSQATGKDNMTLSYFVSTHFSYSSFFMISCRGEQTKQKRGPSQQKEKEAYDLPEEHQSDTKVFQ